jgi:hypothetical protein
MPTVEFLESDAVAGLLQQRDNSPAALVDRQNLVLNRVQHPNGWARCWSIG